MDRDSKWELDRVPSKKEKILGIALSIVILVFFFLILFATASMYLSEETSDKSLVPVFVTLALFFGSLVLFIRVTFSKRRKPSSRAIRNTAYVIFSLSCAMLILPFFVGISPQAIYMIGIGFIGIAGSKALLNRGVVRENS